MGFLLVNCQTGRAEPIEDPHLGDDEVHQGPPEPTPTDLVAAARQRVADRVLIDQWLASLPPDVGAALGRWIRL